MRSKVSTCLLLLLFLLASVLPVACGGATTSAAPPPSGPYENVTAAEAKHLIDSEPGLLILDVRNPSEYDQGHLPGAVLAPLPELETRAKEFDRNAKVLVYCRTGVRSAKAASALAEAGFVHVYNLTGGISAWTSSGCAVEKEAVQAQPTACP